uniref:ATP synthase subunit a n=1 Tax=Pnyxia scabiei TaxID=1781627 RepID=A0A7L9R582_9DIPT|nr:ATP synthase F0 subunit 6 [Pnyxia scabiei]QOL10544.1 ATP synthase F0 subunit 6 [Pnyxia scabiei]
MMTNLFSIFDPTSSIISWPINWISTIMGILLMPTMFWLIPSRFNFIFNLISMKLNNEFKMLLINSNHKKSTLLFISMFYLIMFNNVLGLFPYIFTSTSQMSMTLTLSLPLWISFMLYGWINSTQHMFKHLVPQGTPLALMNFMVCIETMSNLIRPSTLAIRLTANMIAGHLLMTLLGNTGNLIPFYFYYILLITQLMLLTLESAVAIIQAYVFTTLSTLYSSETN